MKQINFIILMFVVLVNMLSTSFADDDYEPSELPNLVSDFNLEYNFFDKQGNSIQGSVDAVATIRIFQQQASDQVYTLTLYIDRSYITREDRISLPYDFKWNFKGLSNGEHEFLFVLKDADEKIGVLTINVPVQH